jgi:YtkA-like
MPPFAVNQDHFEDFKMKSYNYARALQAALIGIAMTGSATLAHADIKDYEFQLVDKTVKKGEAIISVRLVHKPDGKPVPDAVIFATRLDMTPDGMQEMATKIAPVPSSEPGVYKFKATVSMAGGWQLSLGAKVQGETGTIENKLVLKATP